MEDLGRSGVELPRRPGRSCPSVKIKLPRAIVPGKCSRRWPVTEGVGVNTGKRSLVVGKLLVLSCDRVNSIIKLAGAHFDRWHPKLFRVSDD